ncbi:MAG: hypothetical protein ACLQUY_12295 [Ktedonobacterales bacterium]
MGHSNSLSRLSADIAAIRSQHMTVRLVLRNTERFGVLHLYFETGRLVQVHGHKENPMKSFGDLATWSQGTIRQDELAGGMDTAGITPGNSKLEQILDSTLQQLESRGVVQTPPSSRKSFQAQTSPYITGLSPETPPSYTLRHEVQQRRPSPPANEELPTHELFSDMQTMPIASANPSEYVADAQWQLLALVVRQVVDQAGTVIAKDTVDGLIRQSLAYSAVKQPPLRILELDATGWLSPLPGHRISSFPLADVADAIATLLTSFENRCASLIGAEDAHRLIVNAARPFSASLAQLGLAIVV